MRKLEEILKKYPIVYSEFMAESVLGMDDVRELLKEYALEVVNKVNSRIKNVNNGLNNEDAVPYPVIEFIIKDIKQQIDEQV